MRITTTQHGSTAVVKISGAIDVYTASSVGETIQSLIAGGAKRLVLDLRMVNRLDSSGLGTLVGNSKSLASDGGTIWLVGLTSRVSRMLEITNLARYFEIRDDVEVALGEISGLALSQSPS